jgi:RND family efflux transporter MFP subunit
MTTKPSEANGNVGVLESRRANGVEQQAPKLSRTSARVASVIAVLVLAVLGVGIGAGVKRATARKESLAKERETTAAAATKIAPASFVHPTPTRWRPRIEITGTLQPWRSADLGFETGGRLASVLVTTGDVVKQGQTLAVLDTSIAGAQVSQAEAQTKAAEANLAMAEDNLGRTRALVASKSIPEAQAVAAEQQVALAKAQLEGARASERLARTGAGQHSLAAPFAALVTKAPTAAGGVVGPGMPLIHLEDHSHFRLAATVGDEVADLVKPGLEVKLKYRDRTVTGKVSTVIPSLDQATRRAPIEISVPNDESEPLLAWSFVRAEIQSDKDVPALRVPGSARRAGSQDEMVVLKDGKAHVVHVTGAIDEDGSWLVRDGLTASDAVVLDPSSDLQEGDALVAHEARAR